MKSKVLFLLICLISFSCRINLPIVEGYPTDLPTQKVVNLLTSKSDNSIYKLRFDGIYQGIISEYFITNNGTIRDTPYVFMPLYFFENNMIAYDFTAMTSFSLFYDRASLSQREDMHLRHWGVYEVKGDTLKATIYLMLKSVRNFQGLTRMRCSFTGIIQNKDTIKDFKMISPFPETRLSENDNIYRLKKPRDIYFKPFPVKKLVDPEKAWINKFKEKNINKKSNK